MTASPAPCPEGRQWQVQAMIRAALIFLLAFLLLVPTGKAAEPLTKLEECRLVPAEWADGVRV